MQTCIYEKQVDFDSWASSYQQARLQFCQTKERSIIIIWLLLRPGYVRLLSSTTGKAAGVPAAWAVAVAQSSRLVFGRLRPADTHNCWQCLWRTTNRHTDVADLYAHLEARTRVQ